MAYLLFAGMDYYAEGGVMDFRGSFVSEADAVDAALRLRINYDREVPDWWQVVDADTMKVVVFSGERLFSDLAADRKDLQAEGGARLYWTDPHPRDVGDTGILLHHVPSGPKQDGCSYTVRVESRDRVVSASRINAGIETRNAVPEELLRRVDAGETVVVASPEKPKLVVELNHPHGIWRYEHHPGQRLPDLHLMRDPDEMKAALDDWAQCSRIVRCRLDDLRRASREAWIDSRIDEER